MYNGIKKLINNEKLLFNEPMSNHTTFKIGGPVDVLVCPSSVAELQTVVNYCRQHNIPYFVFGLGSNLLVLDKGFRGVAIKLGNNLKSLYISGHEIVAEAGIRLSELARKAAAYELSGLEFAEGIPGSLGGAVVMNAGAYGGEIKDVLVRVSAVDQEGNLKTFNSSDFMMGYRQSIFQENGCIIVSALLELKPGQREEIQSKMRDLARQRREKQPLDLPSAGSTFRRPQGYYVGPMVEKMGLKGHTIGGAQVSTKHAGFIVNTGNATAHDVVTLITYIQTRAREEYGVDLQPELKIIGEQ